MADFGHCYDILDSCRSKLSHEMQILYGNRKRILNGTRILVAILSAHIVLWYGEPEGFFEIIMVDGFIGQYMINALALFALFWLTNRLLHHRRPRISQFRTSKKTWLMFLLKGLLLPVVLAILFGALYYTLHDVPFSLANYNKVVLPIVVGALIIVLVVECGLFALESAVIIFRAFRLSRIQKEKIARALAETRVDVTDELFAKEPIPVVAYRNNKGIEMELQEFRLFDIIGGRAKAFDYSGAVYNLEIKSLRKIKELLVDDPRFFVTGSWIVRYDVIDYVVDGETRAKSVYLKEPFSSYLRLNKEYIRVFKKWQEYVAVLGLNRER